MRKRSLQKGPRRLHALTRTPDAESSMPAKMKFCSGPVPLAGPLRPILPSAGLFRLPPSSVRLKLAFGEEREGKAVHAPVLEAVGQLHELVEVALLLDDAAPAAVIKDYLDALVVVEDPEGVVQVGEGDLLRDRALHVELAVADVVAPVAHGLHLPEGGVVRVPADGVDVLVEAGDDDGNAPRVHGKSAPEVAWIDGSRIVPEHPSAVLAVEHADDVVEAVGVPVRGVPHAEDVALGKGIALPPVGVLNGGGGYGRHGEGHRREGGQSKQGEQERCGLAVHGLILRLRKERLRFRQAGSRAVSGGSLKERLR